ncbi:hypothetical protein L1987_27056 [Smallanthus sonchifolius]|uniref:Uncharacterized protein n=1 Tax=Smallanthus sonchifolius TaxID=185202 RepID=A0ACB9IBL2_9ASTR|nr:hypothetical protein L1987_27056 [Smallanthus sonchifolius]
MNTGLNVLVRTGIQTHTGETELNNRNENCGTGFGRNAIGCRNGRFYIVTDSSDDDPVNLRPGTLHQAVIQDEPLWIVFKRGMLMELVVVLPYSLSLMLSSTIVNRLGTPWSDSWRTMADGDVISIFVSSHIWDDHNSLSNCADRLVDAVMGSKNAKVLIHYLCRHGYFSVVNNDYTQWEMMPLVEVQTPPSTAKATNTLSACPVNPFAKEQAEGYTEGVFVLQPAEAAGPAFVSVMSYVVFPTAHVRRALTSPSTQKFRNL